MLVKYGLGFDVGEEVLSIHSAQWEEVERAVGS
jgi:hypothetical protein